MREMVATPDATSAVTGGAGAGSGRQQQHTLSARVRKIIQSIKEIVGNFSDADIYMVLKETNMDPNETVQKLLNQDPFHEVKRKRDKKKGSMSYRGSVDSRKQPENFDQGMRPRTFLDHDARRGHTRTDSIGNRGVNREFRVVRDNRVNQNANREPKPALPQGSTSAKEKGSGVTEKGSAGISNNLKPSNTRSSSQTSNGPTDPEPRYNRDAKSRVGDRKVVSEEKRSTASNATTSRAQVVKPNNSQQHDASLASSNSVVGVYSSSTDPVHVPSPDSRSSGVVGAIKREVGVVGGRRQSENAVKDLSSSNSFSESFHPLTAISNTDQVRQTAVIESMPSVPVNRSSLHNQYNSRPHQQTVGYPKASQHNKEWKPKSSQKSSITSPGVIGTPTKSSSPPTDNSKSMELNAANLQDKFSRVNIHENQNVIIAQHIRVPESDRCKLTFGSFGVEFDPSRNSMPGFQAVGISEESNRESSISKCDGSLPASCPESSSEDAPGGKQIELLDDQARNSESDSPEAGLASEHQLPEKSSSPPDLDNYADIGLVRNSSPSSAPSESQQQQDHPELPSFSAYDPQSGYDMSYFRPPIDETVQGQGQPSPREALTAHTGNHIPTSTMPTMQQQPPMAQMYPQVHVSPFTNLMPYRQFISPVYVPPMPMPGYSSNPAYPHPSNGNSYMLMPGGGSHLNANGLKYGIQHYKPVPSSNPAGFGNFTSPSGYAINAPGVVGSAAGLEDPSRMKYKDGNIYVPNPQAESSEIWIQNPRDLPGLQSSPYYNIPGQTHTAYLPSHTGHASFNAAAAQSSHMQFPGLYPPPQPTAMASPHHLGPVMGNNVGVGVAPSAPGAQVGAYQQPQLGHLNWTTNF
ncbi:GBF-interacting protein 1-like isoform X2 [Populus nigra]|uniref:GBF-interacting protein 1-like isoform X2 n=1 Tax=Populus nigra TaxID=3691 RepID=UPI002B27230D|nr:GBF-interacting protein 1-like isoform X2 [Populus nigra]